MESGKCLICTDSITLTCLGIEACRACAAFFKRTQISGRRFICRQGDNNCAIRKHANFMCRSCRYDKCVELGMVYDQAQTKKPRSKTKMVEEDGNPRTSISSTEFSRESLLDRMEDEYKTQYERRSEQEREYARTNNLQRFSYPSKEFYIGNLTSYYEMYRIKIRESTTLLQNVFDDFENLPISQRVILFKNFVIKSFLIENVYYTVKYFNNSNNVAGSLMTVFELSNIDQWLVDHGDFENNDAFRTSLKGFSDDFNDRFIPMTKLDALTEREFYALQVLCFCDVDTSHQLIDDVVEKANKTRAKLFKELQDYYRKDLKLHDFTKRLGNLMTMAHGVAEAGLLISEEMNMYTTMFDFYKDDLLFREFFTK